jgi:hypothetical protein
VPSRCSASVRPTKELLSGLDEGLAVHSETRMSNRATKVVMSARMHPSDWPCRRIRTAEHYSAPSFA